MRSVGVPGPHTHLSFNETNILAENIRSYDQLSFIERMDILQQNTEDQGLVLEIKNLLNKIKALSPGEFEQLCKDVQNGKVLFQPNYTLPNIF